MDPVDETIRKRDKERELQNVVPQPRTVCCGVVHFRVSLDFEEKARNGQDGNPRNGGDGLLDFETDLVLDVFWVGEVGGVEDGVVYESCDGKVHYIAE